MGSEDSRPGSISLANTRPGADGGRVLSWRKAGKLPAGEGHSRPGPTPGTELECEFYQSTASAKTRGKDHKRETEVKEGVGKESRQANGAIENERKEKEDRKEMLWRLRRVKKCQRSSQFPGCDTYYSNARRGNALGKTG